MESLSFNLLKVISLPDLNVQGPTFTSNYDVCDDKCLDREIIVNLMESKPLKK